MNWKERLCVFWYIVFVDLAARVIISFTPLVYFITVALRHLTRVTSAGTSGWESSIGLWITVAVRIFEFSVLLHWFRMPASVLLGELGFRRDDWKRSTATGAAAVVILGGGFFLANFLLVRYSGMDMLKMLSIGGSGEGTSGFYSFSYVVAGGLSAAFFEDIFFVGILFSALRKRFTLSGAFALALGHFVAAHILSNILPQMAVLTARQMVTETVIWSAGGALFLGFYARFKSLIPGMMLHCAGNLTIFFAGRV